MKNIASILLLLFLFTASFSQDNSVIDWKADIEFLRQTLPEKHINIFTETSEREFNKELDAIISKLPELSDLQVAIKIQQTISKMRDSHTNAGWVRFVNQNNNIGIGTYWFTDGLYIVSTNENDSILLGKKIIGIGGLDIQIVIDSLKTMFVNENKSFTKQLIPQLLIYPQLLNHFGCELSDQTVELDLINTRNQTSKHCVKLGAKDSVLHSNNFANSLIYGSSNWFVDTYNAKNGLYFVQYNRCDSKELAIEFSQPQDIIDRKPSFEEFKQRVFRTIKEKPIEKFVFDMRFNGGGSSPQGTTFIKELSKLDKVNQEGKLFVLIGRKTFSSAIINTLDFLSETNAILVGEDTGGKASHFGEIRNFYLPNSGLRITYSTKYFYYNNKNKIKVYRKSKAINTKKDTRETIKPNFKVELSFKDYQRNHDPVQDWIVKYRIN